MTVFDSGPCRWCGEFEEHHGARYMALIGAHRWAPMRPAGTSRIVDHPQGGVTQEWTDTPSDRLPPQRGLDMPPELRRSPTNAELDQQEMADMNALAEEHGVDSDADEATRQGIADHYGIDVERVQPALVQHKGQCLPAYRIIGGRPGIIRRIWGATRRSST